MKLKARVALNVLLVLLFMGFIIFSAERDREEGAPRWYEGREWWEWVIGVGVAAWMIIGVIATAMRRGDHEPVDGGTDDDDGGSDGG
ncbi:MAG: hypothetical protein L0220_14140 [Acidobacteria bacterium]|nr:hypothetical protein [Acidobacteriota bacterium]